MSTVRIQIRRGESTDWESIDPVLADGEMGIEIDTNKVKVGNNGANWTDLPYLNVVPTDLDNTLGDYVLVSDVGNAGGPAKLDVDGNLLIPKSSIILEGSTADAYETTLTITDPTADRTITIPNASGTIALTSDLDAYATTEALNSVVSSLNIHQAVELATTSPLSATYANGTADNANGTGIGATLTMNSTGVVEIDGFAIEAGSRILVKDQANLLHNGIYDVTTAGAVGVAAVLTRSADYNNSLEKTPADVSQGDVVYVIAGNTNALKQFSQIYEGTNTDGSVKIGIDDIDFTQVSGTATIIPGVGIIKNGDELSVDSTAFLSVVNASNTYLTQSSASSTYLSQTNAQDNYLKQSDASSTYLTQTNASNTYLTQTNAQSTYFAKDTTQIGNSNIATGASIDPNKISGNAVTQADTGTVTNTMLAGSIANNKLANSTISGKSLGSDLDALTIGTGLSGTSYDGSAPVTIAIDSTVATKTYVDDAGSDLQDAIDLKAPINSPTFTGTVSGIDKTMVGLNNVDNTSDLSKPISTDTQNALDLKADLAGPTFTGTVTTGDLIINGDVTVNSGEFLASATSITIEDNLIQLAHGNVGNTVDLGIVVGYNDGTAKHAGIVRDVSANEWKLFKGVTTEPATTVDFTQGSLDDLELNNLTAAGIIFTDGTQTKEGVPSRTPIISKTGNYTLSALTERDSLIEVDSTSPVTITIPTNSAVAFPIGTTLDILGVNTGLITIAGDSGVTVNATPGLKLRTQWSSCTLFKRGENAWVVYGDLKA